MTMLAGALTDSPMWLPWAAYWVCWTVAHAVYWWLSTATRNMEAIAPCASIVYWWLVLTSGSMFGRSWKRLSRAYGIREAVDFGANAGQLGKITATLVQTQTRLRVQSVALSLLASGTVLGVLLGVGVLGAWTLVAVVFVPAVWWVRRLNGARWD